MSLRGSLWFLPRAFLICAAGFVFGPSIVVLIHQVLSNQYDPHLSPYSYGFRPKRSAIQAVKQAQSYLTQGNRWVVDMDLEKFFDRVNYDLLMSRLARNIKDKTVLKLIRSYLQSGIMEGGITTARTEGHPRLLLDPLCHQHSSLKCSQRT